MAFLIEFKTSKFDPRLEPENPINPIAGRSILVWLRETILPNAIEPDYEDWGWYTEVNFQEAHYLIGGICFYEEGPVSAPLAWMIQIHKHQSFMDKMLGRNKIQLNDPLAAKIVAAVRAEADFVDVKEQVHA